ncbi:MAG: Uncharacterized protein JWM02_3646 [Frankiales bacterium]|nr:Uncharacterized protein [Frankiales bacterium]
MRDPEFFMRRYAPVTTRLAFFDISAAAVAEAVFDRDKEMTERWELPWKVKKVPIESNLAGKLHALLPLSSVRASKLLLSATRSNWSAYIPNGYPLGDIHGEPSFFAEKLKVRTLSIVLSEDVPKKQVGSFQFVLRDARSGPVKTRSVELHKESRWQFRQYGDPLPFEDVEQYRAKKLKDRLTVDMVERYCSHLGIELFDPDFYAGEGHIIHSYPPPNSVFYSEYPNQKQAGPVTAS